MSDPSTPQSSKSRRSRGTQPPTIEADAERIEDETPVAEASTEEATAAQGEPGPADEARSASDAQESDAPESDTPAEQSDPSETGAPKTEQSNPPEADAPAAEAPRKSPASSGKAAVVGLIFGLIGGVAGAAIMQYAMPAAPVAAPQSDAQITALEKRLSTVEAAMRDSAQKVAEADKAREALGAMLKATDGRIEALAQQAPPSTGGNADAAAAALDQRIATLDGAMQAASAATKNQIDNIQRSLAAVNGRFDAIEKQVAAAEKPVADPMPAIRYVLAMRLDQAVASGKPFTNALKATTEAGIDGAALADVAPFAVSGAPSAAQLKAEFKDPSQAMIAQERGQTGETFTDKLTRMGKSVLRIRPQGTPEGTDIGSMVVRIEAALDRGAFAEAAGLWNSLPDPMKQLSAAWGKRINDRANAANALAKLSANAAAGLEGAAR